MSETTNLLRGAQKASSVLDRALEMLSRTKGKAEGGTPKRPEEECDDVDRLLPPDIPRYASTSDVDGLLPPGIPRYASTSDAEFIPIEYNASYPHTDTNTNTNTREEDGFGKKRAENWSAVPAIIGSSKKIIDSLSQAAASTNSPPEKSNPSARKLQPMVKTSTQNDALRKIPSICLASLLNLMLCVPFGYAFFPIDWEPFPADRSIGLRMWFFSTAISQIVFTFNSSFPFALGMMMVENISFMHAIAEIVVGQQGKGADALSTTLVCFGLSTMVVGVTFLLLGKLNLGSIVFLFPKHVIVGCIGGIGVFVCQTGLEVSTGLSLTRQSLNQFLAPEMLKLWLLTLFLVALLRLLLKFVAIKKKEFPLLAPAYFLAITPASFAVRWVLDVSLKEARELGFFFPDMVTQGASAPSQSAFQMFSLIDLGSVDWNAIKLCMPTVIGLTVFSLMHVPINIPSLSMSTGVEANMNDELIAHGYSNLISGVFGGCQNYMCYSNSFAYFKSGGGGKIESLVITGFSVIFFFQGEKIIQFVPRTMAGTLLVHVGLELFAEGVYDSFRSGFDKFEYTTIWIIVLSMSTLGMTTGLFIGCLGAAITFAVNAAIHIEPVRGWMRGTTLRSQRYRTQEARDILASEITGRSRLAIVQLQGNLYFANQKRFEDLIRDIVVNESFLGVVLDFTLVNGIDGSAAFALVKLKDFLSTHGILFCVFVTGREIGFPCTFDLTEKLTDGEFRAVVAANLDAGLAYCEDGLISLQAPGLGKEIVDAGLLFGVLVVGKFLHHFLGGSFFSSITDYFIANSPQTLLRALQIRRLSTTLVKRASLTEAMMAMVTAMRVFASHGTVLLRILMQRMAGMSISCSLSLSSLK